MIKTTMIILLSMFVLSIVVNTASTQNIYAQYYQDAKQIVAKMSLEQKLGQMSQPDIGLITKSGKTNEDAITKYFLGSLLIGGDGCPDNNGDLQTDNVDYLKATKENWKKLGDRLMSRTVDVALDGGQTAQISLLLGTDAVHGNQHVIGLPLFPHNIGLSATHNVENFDNAGYWTATKTLQSGFNFVFAPTVAVSHNPQWGRFYETLGSDSSNISNFAQHFVQAAQMYNGTLINGVMTSTKHFLGDGSTLNGNDEGNVRIYNFTAFYENNVQGYRGAILSQTGNVMASYSAVNGIPMSINAELLTGKLRQEEQFGGFVISDYDQMGQIAEQGLPTSFLKMTQVRAACMIINAGVDMMMLPGFRSTSIEDFANNIKQCLNNGDVQISRVDDATMRIIAVKMAMGLVQITTSGTKSSSQSSIKSITNEEKLSFMNSLRVGNLQSTNILNDVLKAAQESLVLLKNDDNLLPISKGDIKYIVLVGERQVKEKLYDKQIYQDFDNIGAQSGGWSVRWQGFEGNTFWSGKLQEESGATSILDGLKQVLKSFGINYQYPSYRMATDAVVVDMDRDDFLASLDQLVPFMTEKNTLILGAISESPYAEFMGDINSKYCQQNQTQGCLYNNHANEYYSGKQRTSMNLTYDAFSWKVINKVRGQNNKIPLVSVLLTGRPFILDEVVAASNAFIAAWLPGTSGGEAIVNSLFGEYLFKNSDENDLRNTLPIDWMADSDSLVDFPIYRPDGKIPEFKNQKWVKGYGLSTQKKESKITIN